MSDLVVTFWDEKPQRYLAVKYAVCQPVLGNSVSISVAGKSLEIAILLSQKVASIFRAAPATKKNFVSEKRYEMETVFSPNFGRRPWSFRGCGGSKKDVRFGISPHAAPSAPHLSLSPQNFVVISVPRFKISGCSLWDFGRRSVFLFEFPWFAFDFVARNDYVILYVWSRKKKIRI